MPAYANSKKWESFPPIRPQRGVEKIMVACYNSSVQNNQHNTKQPCTSLVPNLTMMGPRKMGAAPSMFLLLGMATLLMPSQIRGEIYSRDFTSSDDHYTDTISDTAFGFLSGGQLIVDVTCVRKSL
jgi:hypothetical protein